MRLAGVMVLAAALVACAAEPVSLFDGKTLAGWKVVTCEAEVVDGAILLKAGNGYLQAEKEYADFVFECEWKALSTNMWDSGVYFRAGEPQGKFPWPKEHQVNMRKGQEGSIHGADRAKAVSLYKPGEWNHFKLTVKGQTASLEFNGEPAWARQGIVPAKGHLCLQAEVPNGGQFLFRKLTILELEPEK